MRFWILTGLLLTLATPAGATSCPQLFAGGVAPVITNQRLIPRSAELCYLQFAVFHSGLTKTPLWVAERLTASDVKAAGVLERELEFFVEAALPEEDRSELSDYRRSGYDRGHMAPAADMISPEAMRQSFMLSNIIPQQPDINRGLWRDVEGVVRDLAKDRGELFVVTGPLFLGDTLDALQGRVVVPTHVFKAIYDPARGEAGAYVAANGAEAQWQRVTIDQLGAAAGFDLFPDAPASARATLMALPALEY